MCALLRELIVPVGDLRRLAVECSRCKSVTVLDFTTRIQMEGGPIAPSLAQCPVCDRPFTSGLKDRIRALAAVLDWLDTQSEEPVSFRVAPPVGVGPE